VQSGEQIKPAQQLYRRATAAKVLDCHVSLLKRLEDLGVLSGIRLGLRDTFYHVEDIERLAREGLLVDEQASKRLARQRKAASRQAQRKAASKRAAQVAALAQPTRAKRKARARR
jgi:hypothetical protein